jgi:UrcA family protein
MTSSIAARAAGPRAKFGLLVLGSLAGLMAAGAASADSDVPQVVVKYSAESLTTDEGVNDLYRRIVQAANQVCPDPWIRDLARRSEATHCRNQAIARAIRYIDNSRLAAVYAVHSKNG